MGLSFTPPLFPPALSRMFTPTVKGCYSGKKILSIHGEIDTLVPYSHGADSIALARKECVESGGEMEIFVQDGAGHVVTPEMLKRVADWVWRLAAKSELVSSM